MGKEKIIPTLALLIICISVISSIYVYATTIEKETITINNNEYSIDEIFLLSQEITITTVEGEKTGVSLENLITKSGISCPSCNEYTIKAADGYQKTMSWDDFKTGVITNFKRVFFPDAPKAFWVRDIVEIEVKNI